MDKKKGYIKKISNYSIVGGLGATLVLGLLGCSDGGVGGEMQQLQSGAESIQKQGAFVVIEKDPNGGYKIVEEFPSKETRVVLRENGSERILSQEEIDKIIKEEQAKIEAGTSDLLKAPEEVSSGGGMGLAGTLLSSAAGAILGSYIGNKLFNNQNFQSQRSTRYQTPSAYSRSVDSFGKSPSSASAATKTTASQTTSNAPKKSGFFSGSGSSQQGTSSFGG